MSAPLPRTCEAAHRVRRPSILPSEHRARPLPAAGLPHVQPANWLVMDWGAVQWVPFLNVMFWNLNM